jgi:hypothetical protein
MLYKFEGKSTELSVYCTTAWKVDRWKVFSTIVVSYSTSEKMGYRLIIPAIIIIASKIFKLYL